MRKLQEMINWNYKEAYEFFSKNAMNKYIPESAEYVKSLKISSTVDLRANTHARELILESINSKTLILVDGGSCNGKSTIAKRIAKHTDAIVLDIDLICKEWVERNLKNIQNEFEYIEFALRVNELTDKYLLDELENIVCQKSQLGKPVILVGAYIEILYRAIVARTLGKYFERVVSLVCCEKSFKQVEKFLDKRKAEFSTDLPEQRDIALKEYKLVQEIINQFNAYFLGIGMTTSFIVDSNVSNMFM